MQLQKPRTCTSESRRGHSAQGCASTRSDTEQKQAVCSCVWCGVGWGPQNLDDFNNSGAVTVVQEAAARVEHTEEETESEKLW